MVRRDFLRNGTLALAGGLLGLNGFQTALAAGSDASGNTQGQQPPRVALIIDDIGFSRSKTRRFLSLGIPITFAVLPKLARSVEIALEIHENHHEIMLHQPMEPTNPRLNPGPGALFVGSDPEKIQTVLRENIREIPFAIGVNNHMGSRFTASAHDIRKALTTIQTTGLFFIDSLTSGRSLAYRTARQLNMTTARRNTFLDSVPEVPAVVAQLARLKRHADRFGSAVGIGHPFGATAEGIRRFIDSPAHADVSLVHISEVLA